MLWLCRLKADIDVRTYEYTLMQPYCAVARPSPPL
jgi:hypothetical protein